MWSIKEVKRKLIFCGDIHGEFEELINSIKGHDITNTDIVICGDIGVGFKGTVEELNWLRKVKRLEWISHSGNKIYCVRGNHDDPEEFLTTRQFVEFAPIYLVADYSLLELDAASVLCIGGGFSIDFGYRKAHGWPWWKGEMPIYDANKLATALAKPYERLCIATHSAPDFCEPTTKVPNATKPILDGCEKERAIMTNIWKGVDFQIPKSIKVDWYYGHFHASNNMVRDNMTFHGLDIQELKDYRHSL